MLPKTVMLGLLLTGLAAAEVPLTMDQAIREALDKNLDLAAERFNISVAEARRITASLRPNPVLTLDADHLDLLGTHFSNINNAGPNEYSLRTDFVLERGGKRGYRTAVATADIRAAELGVKEVSRRLMLDVENAGLDLLQAKAALALAQENLKSLEGIVEINRTRVKAGDLALVELNRSEVAAMQYRNQVQQAALQVTQARTRLATLLGRPNADGLDLGGDFRGEQLTAEAPALTGRALEQRPDLLYVRQAEVRNQADLKLQIANGKVDLTVGTEVRRQDAQSGRGNSMGFFVQMPLPIFNRNQGEIVRAQREREQSVARAKALENTIQGEVTAALAQYRTSQALLTEIERSMLPRAREVRQTTEYSYRRGEASLVEFLDAQRAFNDTVQSYNDARASYARSLYLLDAVTGASVNP